MRTPAKPSPPLVICEFPSSCHSTAFSFFLSCRNNFSLPVMPQHFLSSCHTGLRAGIRVNIDSLAPGFRVKPGMTVKKQARNDNKKTSPE